jgi:hypothetical protein
MSEENTSAETPNDVDQSAEENSTADKLYDKEPDSPEEEKPIEEKSEGDESEAKPDSESEDNEEKKAYDAKYTFETDEDSPLTDEHLSKIAQIAKERNLSNEEAQALVDMQEEAFKGFQSSIEKQVEENTKQWFEDAKNDPEFGKDKFEKSAELAKRVIDRYATDEFKQAVNETGLGNHPELLRLFVRIGNAMSEDSLVLSGSQNTVSEKTAAEIFYNNTKQ